MKVSEKEEEEEEEEEMEVSLRRKCGKCGTQERKKWEGFV